MKYDYLGRPVANWKFIWLGFAVVVLLFILTACKGGGGNDAPKGPCAAGCTAVTIQVGCAGPAANDTLMVSPEAIDTTQPPASYEPHFEPLGSALKQWAGVLPRSTDFSCSGGVVDEYRLNLKVTLNSSGVVSSQTNSAMDCALQLDPATSSQTWGHELWHCIDGAYHP